MMLLFALALVSAPQSCVDTRQQCRACPTDGKQGCSSVGIACQPVQRICHPAAAAKAPVHTDRTAGAKRLR